MLAVSGFCRQTLFQGHENRNRLNPSYLHRAPAASGNLVQALVKSQPFRLSGYTSSLEGKFPVLVYNVVDHVVRNPWEISTLYHVIYLVLT